METQKLTEQEVMNNETKGIFTLHNQYGDYMSEKFRSLNSAIKACQNNKYKCKVLQEYIEPSPWNPNKLSKHGREVFRNYDISIK